MSVVTKANQQKPDGNKQSQEMVEVEFEDEDEDEEGVEGENGKQGSPMKVDLIQLVRDSNVVAAELFFQYSQAEEDDEKQELFDQIKNGLKVHSALVEELYYPLLPESAKEEDKEEAQELVYEAEAANYVASMILDVLDSMKPSDDYFDGKMAVLHKLCKEQCKREEKEMLEKLKAAETEIDFEELGQAAMERQMELEEEMESMGKRSKSKAKAASKSSRAKAKGTGRGGNKGSSAKGRKTSAKSASKKSTAKKSTAKSKAATKARSGSKPKASASTKGSQSKATASKSKTSSRGKASSKSKSGGKSKTTARAGAKPAKKPASKASAKKATSKRKK